MSSIAHKLARFGIAAALMASLWVVASPALADAVVVVSVRNANGSPADGTVTLTQAGRSFSCQTHGGSCQIAGVPGGMHTATFTPTSGTAPPPRNVMVAPSGSVSLSLPSGH